MSERLRPDSVMVHPSALCESPHVGPRTRIWAFAHVMPGAVVGADCNLCDHTYIDDGAHLGDFVTVKNGVSVWNRVTLEDDVFVGPAVAFTNDRTPRARPYRTLPDEYLPTLVRRGATLGANATIICGVRVGCHALVGAGAIVTADVADHAVVVGGPARPVGWICVCGRRLDVRGPDRELYCACGRGYRSNSSCDRIKRIGTPAFAGAPASRRTVGPVKDGTRPTVAPGRSG